MRFSPFFAGLSSGLLTRWWSVSLLSALLFGCSLSGKENQYAVDDLNRETVPQLINLQQETCEKIWAFNTLRVLEHPLYWLRIMDCAQRLSPEDARAVARDGSADNWQSRFKQAILLSQSNVSVIERRHYLQRVDSDSHAFPATLRPLLVLWREGQGALLQLSVEHARYIALRQSSDQQLDALRQQQGQLNQELSVIRHKLDSLTDIERQLSSRRFPDGVASPPAVDLLTPNGKSSSGIQSESDSAQ